jgi:hypothetical protein
MIIDYKHDTLNEVVVKLHELARIVEREIGFGQMSTDIRKTADKLNDIIKD